MRLRLPRRATRLDERGGVGQHGLGDGLRELRRVRNGDAFGGVRRAAHCPRSRDVTVGMSDLSILGRFLSCHGGEEESPASDHEALASDYGQGRTSARGHRGGARRERRRARQVVRDANADDQGQGVRGSPERRVRVQLLDGVAVALALKGVELFDPGMGRPMKEWVVVPASHAKRWPELAETARAYVAEIAAKAPAKKKKR